MIPSIVARQLKDGLAEYLETTFPISNEFFKDSMKDFIEEKGRIFRDPYISIKLPFKKGEKGKKWFEGIEFKYTPHAHQEKSFKRLLGDPRSTLVATGTGSGKTECFLMPILEYCYHNRGTEGIKAIIIYPMNALASDQAKRIAEIVNTNKELKNNVTVGMYVGDKENTPTTSMTADKVVTDRNAMRRNPPDILLTNYKMLDYLLTRPDDYRLWNQNKPETLKFLAVDEFHTFDGAQGTDLACLIRRIKDRLKTEEKYLTCIGTSATMGSEKNKEKMLEFASNVFGEEFDEDSIVTEERDSPEEFLDEAEIITEWLPRKKDLLRLKDSVERDDYREFIATAYNVFFDEGVEDIEDSEFKLQLSRELMGNYLFQEIIEGLNNEVVNYKVLLERMEQRNKMLSGYSEEEKVIMVEGITALVSHARADGNRPFLHVHVQLWFKELRRMLASLGTKPEFLLADDSGTDKEKTHVPAINCRDCGATGWASSVGDNGRSKVEDITGFYSQFFGHDKKVTLMFPLGDEKNAVDINNRGTVCTKCSTVKDYYEGDKTDACGSCGHDGLIDVLIERPNISGSAKNNNYSCPVCESKSGLILIGAQGTTLISAGVSELFASKYNDDKKILAFSDSVQDASHKSGFLNSRTWRFNLRVALQSYIEGLDRDINLKELLDEVPNYWEKKLGREGFMATFIPPNMTWMAEFEYLVENGRLSTRSIAVNKLIEDIKRRMKMEIIYEYGFRNRVGRTLEKSGASILSLDSQKINKSAGKIIELLQNQLGFMTFTKEDLTDFIYGMLTKLKQGGGIEFEHLNSFIETGQGFLLSNKHMPWMPGLTRAKTTPKFILESTRNPKVDEAYTNLGHNSWYVKWFNKALNRDNLLLSKELPQESFKRILKVLRDEKLLFSKTLKKRIGMEYDIPVYGLSNQALTISKKVVQVKCNVCGHSISVSADEVSAWNSLCCLKSECRGHYEEAESGKSFYGRLYSSGDVCRVFASEHTGLLEGPDREQVEKKFKKKREDQKAWDINLLSCTPTLEMGIDIGDLSTIILCSVPPSQAQFLQRIGRPGRKDGNAVSVVVANAKEHDLYFYEDPMEMLSGDIQPPGVFLNASSVLERQFTAYCFDNWINIEEGHNKIPDKIRAIMSNIKKKETKEFPYDFLNYITLNLTDLFNEFLGMFRDELEKESIEKLRSFAFGGNESEGSVGWKLINTFERVSQERDSIKEELKKLKKHKKDIEKLPKDISLEEDIKRINMEISGLADVIDSINNKNLYNFLCDEGLLPNYAFPEAGVILKSIINRKLEKDEENHLDKGKKKYIYEYSRPAASAIHELAPGSSFYANGRKINVDQIDMKVSEPEVWRLCPNCSHSQREIEGKDTASCPKCGSLEWRDTGQLKSMLRFRQVYSTEDYEASRSGDESDSRETKFFMRKMLVSVEEENDILEAYEVGDEKSTFGFEFLKKATLREVNFGESSGIGETNKVAGEERVRRGFKVCKECGKIQNTAEHNTKNKKYNHTWNCPNKGKEGVEESYYLYREFTSEAIRVLIPAINLDITGGVMQSFIAAVNLGLKKYFGSVEHLKTTISEEPIPNSNIRKNYLVIYDSIPGGTGYLKDIMKADSFVNMLEAGLVSMRECGCEDGCYKCLFAYKQSRYIGEISKKAAINIFSKIIENKDKIVSIKSIGDISINHILESELEKRFIESFKRSSTGDREITIKNQLVKGKPGYRLTVGNSKWEIEPQVELGPNEGVSLYSRPDFVIRPLRIEGRENKGYCKPIAVFTDGYKYHKNIVGEDMKKRLSILNSGEYYVWSLSWNDVQGVFETMGDYYTNNLSDSLTIKKMKDKCKLELSYEPKVNSYKILLDILESNSRIQEIRKFNFLNILGKDAKPAPYDTIEDKIKRYNLSECIEKKVVYVENESNNLKEFHFINASDFNKKEVTASVVILEDRSEYLNDSFIERDWNGFLRNLNITQFQKGLLFTTESHLDKDVYPVFEIDKSKEDKIDHGRWNEVLEELIDEEAVNLIEFLKDEGIEELPKIGFELVDDEEVIGEAELVWEDHKVALLMDYQEENLDIFKENNWTTLLINKVDREELVILLR